MKVRHTLSHNVRGVVTWEGLGVEPLLLYQEEPAEVGQASVWDVSWRGVPGISHWEETPRKTQETLEVLRHRCPTVATILQYQLHKVAEIPVDPNHLDMVIGTIKYTCFIYFG